ncbi:7-deoxyloganetic acid glucosyltransferase [Neltuma alba]|uniref:7-deoxyloganetic acid glucosyltransferase n=1 Tax=Neltuma alba TaxID=207710 RepID=UPI0010A452D4|nr:7-deoxyloganetic acid glucosyltransferase-like [Prosopis alba]
MTRGEYQCETETHVLMFPLPAQGHVNCMLQLAELLVLSDVHVTFLNTEHVHHRLLRFADVPSRLAAYPTLHFETFSDGLPSDDPRHGDNLGEHIKQVNLTALPQLREICMEDSGKPRFSCIVGDGIFGRLTYELGQELGIPVVYFRTVSACSFWAYFCAPRLLECNELPIRGEDDMDRMITSIPGMENLVRCRDLPSFFRGTHNGNLPLEPVVFETHQSLRGQALILNTFEDLEGPVLSKIRLHFPRLYALGPLHAHLTSRKAAKTMSSEEKPAASFISSLWEVDRSCMTWLDAQPPKSVIYVSFGSITTISRDMLTEIWYGLVNSKKRFLWVIRPDMVAEQDGKDLPLELVEGTKERGCMVGWAPQQDVLAHAAIGGFMTHSGWNSTLEGVVASVPMICWPYFADQQINSRYVSEVWKIGLDMKDTCDRKVVEKMVNDVMEERREEFEKSTQAMANLAKTSVREGGSSYSDFDRLVEFLKLLGTRQKQS